MSCLISVRSYSLSIETNPLRFSCHKLLTKLLQSLTRRVIEMKEISFDNLQKFENIFSVDKEKHVVILLTIKTFIYRFELFPELKNKAKLFALTDDWENDGIFFMTVSQCAYYYNLLCDTWIHTWLTR